MALEPKIDNSIYLFNLINWIEENTKGDFMNSKVSAVFGAVIFSLTIGAVAHAEDGVVAQDQQRINQDKKDIHQDNANIQTANKAIAADMASGNKEQLKKDRLGKREAKHNKAREKKRLKRDRRQKHLDEMKK